MSDELRVVASGGGVQSTALLVLAARREVEYSEFVLANVGDDSENPDTLTYLREYALPFAAAHNLTYHVLDRQGRGGRTLVEHIHHAARQVPIPMRPAGGGPGRRICTGDWKIKPIHRWLKRRGATAEQPATVALGISVDEYHRVHAESGFAEQRTDYPLIRLRLTRADCKRIIAAAGLPVPAKSSCFFCPYHRPAEWAAMRREHPELFAAAAAIETELRERSIAIGREPVWLSRFGRSLTEAITDTGQLSLPTLDPQDGSCDSGYCWL